MIPTSLAALAEITGGSLAGICDADAAALILDGPVVTDSREAEPGSLYVARVGAVADGHDFIAGAAARGARAALVTREVAGLLPESRPLQAGVVELGGEFERTRERRFRAGMIA